MAVGILGLLGCKVTPEGGNSMGNQHCSDLQGDFTCQSIYSGRPFCSLCTDEMQGCVVTRPALICQPEFDTDVGVDTGDDEGTTGGSDSSGGTTVALDGTGTEGTTGEPPCEAEGEVDQGCMELDPSRPFCFDAECVGCEDMGGDGFCGDLDLTTPACSGGSCVGCDAAARPVCGDGTPVCGDEGACQACVAHDECPSGACHIGPDDALLGHCFLPEEVIWVDNSASCPGLGTMEAPMCSLTAAADTVEEGDSRVLHIVGGTPYSERAAFSGAMAVALIGEGAPVIGGAPGQQAATLSFDMGVTAYVQGLHVNGNALTHGILCNDSYVKTDQVELRNNDGWGVFDFQPCTLDIQRTVIAGNEDGGVRLNGGQLSLTNAAVGLNGVGGNSTGVRVISGNVDILYSTIAGNDGSGADSIECTAATGTLRNSIVVGADPVSISLDCFPLVMGHNALDAANFASGTNVAVEAYNPIYFNGPTQGNFTLSAPPLTPYGDVALWVAGDPERDADGTLRPMGGMPGYAGVDQP